MRSFELQADVDVQAALDAAARAQRAWRLVPVRERVGQLTRIASALGAGKARYAEMIVREMGKPLAQAEAEIEKCALNRDFYAENAPLYLAAGNGAILKHANNVSECALAVQELMDAAGIRAGLTATLLIDSSKVAALIAEYDPPTVLDHVKPGMTAFREETFGPVAAIIRAKDADQAVAMANDSEYGLGAALWTGDTLRGHILASRIDAAPLSSTV
jgi:acyl-CoA reductase-like NAD-dependent aldehyde dehydrogenase